MKIFDFFHSSPKEIQIISFPKCGRTWLRLMIGKYLSIYNSLQVEDEMDLLSISKRIPGQLPIKITHEDSPHFKKPSELSVKKEGIENSKIIFLIRDPRDVCVSLYFEIKFRKDLYKNKYRQANSSLSEFLKSETSSLQTIIKYYNIWLNQKIKPKNFLLVKYEDLHENTHKEMEKIAQFISKSKIDQELLNKIINSCSFEAMHELERNNSLNTFRLTPGKIDEAESYKTRKGKVQGYKDYFSDEDILYANELISNQLSKSLSIYY